MTVADEYLPTIAEFERGDIDPARFDHRAHIYVGWLYTGTCPLSEAIGRFTAALKRLTVQIGASDKYHETITWCFLLVIAERRLQADEGWDAFRRDNDDLFGRSADVLGRHYSPELLATRAARETFVLPDRGASEAA